MKKLILLICVLIPIVGIAAQQEKVEFEKSIMTVAFLFIVVIIGVLFKVFLMFQDSEREDLSRNGPKYGVPKDGGGYEI